MTDEELRKRFDDLEKKIDQTQLEASNKGHFLIIILLVISIAIAAKACH